MIEVNPRRLKVETTWGRFTKGDTVRVEGRRGVYAFVAHVTDLDRGSSWVNVHGPLPRFSARTNPRAALTRSFDPTLIHKKKVAV